MRDELRNYVGSAQELIYLFRPFTHLTSPTTATRYLDKYLDITNPSDNPYDEESIEAYQTLIRNGDIDSYDALNAATSDAFKYAVENGFIGRGHDYELMTTDTTVAQFYLTSKGWKTLEENTGVSLERWDNTIEVEEVGRDYQLNPTDYGSYTVNTVELPRHLDLEVLWEDGLVHIEPTPQTALVHLRGDTAHFVGVE